MSTNGYQYVIELFRADDSPLGQASVKVDWGPAEEWAKFQAMRRGLLAPNGTGRVTSIEPIWLREVGEPYIEGVRVNVAAGSGEASADFSTSYFKSLAAQLSQHFIEKGRLDTGERFRFLAAAFPQQGEQSNDSRLQFTTEEAPSMIEFKNSSLAETVAASVPHGT